MTRIRFKGSPRAVKAADSQPLAWGSPRNEITLGAGRPWNKAKLIAAAGVEAAPLGHDVEVVGLQGDGGVEMSDQHSRM